MGCTFAKNGEAAEGGNKKKTTTTAAADGGGAAVIPAIPAPAPVDPRLPLTAKQRFSIGKSWKGIARAMEPTGVAMFIALFEEEGMLALFERFRELRTRDAQASSLELQQHAVVVMQTLDESIQALENVDYFFEYVQQAGANHLKVPGFQKDFFWKIEKPFLLAVKQTLGDRYTENMESIYTIVIHFILDNMVKGFENAQATAK